MNICRISGFQVFITILSVILSCSNSSDITSSGNSSETVIGMVVNDSGEPYADNEVILKSIVITPNGDSVVDFRQTSADKHGKFTFADVTEGIYVAYSETETGAGIISGIEKGSGHLQMNRSLVVSDKVVLKGRVLGDDEVSVSIPGIEKRASIDSSGFYVLQDVPIGNYRLSFISGSTVNYLNIEIESTKDTVFIRDVAFADIPKEANTLSDPFPSTLENRFSVTAMEYADTNQPEWYTGKVFDNVNYEEGVTSFRFDNESGNKLWSEPLNWSPDGVPGESDTAFIGARECILPEDESVFHYIHLTGGSILDFRCNVSEADILVENSTIRMDKAYTVSLKGNIHVNNSYMIIQVGDVYESRLILAGTLSGSRRIIKRGAGVATLEGDTTEFRGDWIVEQNKLRVRMPYATGRGNVYVKPNGIIDIEEPKGLYGCDTLFLSYDKENENYGSIEININASINSLKIGDDVMESGLYLREDHSEFMTGGDSLYVRE